MDAATKPAPDLQVGPDPATQQILASLKRLAEELAVLRAFWDTFWEDVATVECSCGLSAYEHEDMSRIEAAQDVVATFYEQRATEAQGDLP